MRENFHMVHSEPAHGYPSLDAMADSDDVWAGVVVGLAQPSPGNNPCTTCPVSGAVMLPTVIWVTDGCFTR